MIRWSLSTLDMHIEEVFTATNLELTQRRNTNSLRRRRIARHTGLYSDTRKGVRQNSSHIPGVGIVLEERGVSTAS